MQFVRQASSDNAAARLAKLAKSQTATVGGIEAILSSNKQWADQMHKTDPTFFDKCGAGQAPKYLWIGCADSRVPAAQLMGLAPGEVFVHRNIAGLVVSTDMNMLSVLQYAVEALEVTDIIVTGHYECGGVAAAMKEQDLGLIENWLRNIRDVYRLHRAELNKINDKKLKHRRLVELTCIEQCVNIFKTGIVQRKRLTSVDGETPRVHAMTFDPANGLLKELKVDYEKHLGDLEEVYSLYDGAQSCLWSVAEGRKDRKRKAEESNGEVKREATA